MWTLAFLVASLHALAIFLYYSQVACPSFNIPLELVISKLPLVTGPGLNCRDPSLLEAQLSPIENYLK